MINTIDGTVENDREQGFVDGGTKMNESIGLIEKRQELQDQLLSGNDRALVNWILNGLGRLIQRLSRRPQMPPPFYSAFLIALLVLLLDLSVSFLRGEFRINYRLEFIPAELVLAAMIFATLAALKIYQDFVFRALRENLVENVHDIDDLTDLRNWATKLWSARDALFWGLLLVIAGSSYFVLPVIYLGEKWNTTGPLIVGAAFFFASGVALHYFIHVLTLPLRLSRYNLKIFGIDPKSSDIIETISGLTTSFTYITAALMTAVTVLLVLLKWTIAPIIVPVLVTAWVLMIILFVTSQYALHRIIAKAKQKTLNDLQMRIEQLHNQGNLAEKDTMEAINRLLDYHDRIKGSPDSALNLRAVLSFVNSLLLPLIAFLLSNLKNIIALVD